MRPPGRTEPTGTAVVAAAGQGSSQGTKTVRVLVIVVVIAFIALLAFGPLVARRNKQAADQKPNMDEQRQPEVGGDPGQNA